VPNDDNIKKWIEALRSGEFKKGKGSLVQVDSEGNKKYCCLGVACALAGLEEAKVKVIDEDKQRIFALGFKTNGDVETSFLPKQVQQWLGITEKNPLVETNAEGILTTEAGRLGRWIRSLSDVNDGGLAEKEVTFSEIADLIEKQWLSKSDQ
jgi:hypothetical protein